MVGPALTYGFRDREKKVNYTGQGMLGTKLRVGWKKKNMFSEILIIN